MVCRDRGVGGYKCLSSFLKQSHRAGGKDIWDLPSILLFMAGLSKS